MRWLLLAAVVLAAADNDANSRRYYWDGPQSGCKTFKGSGVRLHCALPSALVKMTVGSGGESMYIECEKYGKLSCKELQEAKPFIDEHVHKNASTNIIKQLTIKTCDLGSESLLCPLKLLNVTGSTTLILHSMDRSLEKVNMQSLEGIKTISMYYVAKNITTVPYEELSVLPTLNWFTMAGGALVLKPTEAVLPTLTHLELVSGGLTTLPKGAFNSTPNIEVLLLWGNKINYIDPGAFEGIPKLLKLSLNHNFISHLPGYVFGPTPRLQELLLYENQLQELHQYVFSGLQRLSTVNIFNNRVSLVIKNCTFCNLPSLTHLALNKSKITALSPDTFENTTNLINLSLSRNKITTLPDNLLLNRKLKVLILDFNSFEVLPKKIFSNLDSLEELNLSNNLFKEIPDELFLNLTNLKVLNLSSNKLEKLNSTSFSGLHNVEMIFLAKNKINYIEEGAFKTTKLKNLSLSDNGLTINENINSKTVVKRQNNTDILVHYSFLSDLGTLRTLDLSYNKISIICHDWKNFNLLEKLVLSFNSLQALQATDMQFVTATEVDVSHNKIQQLAPRDNIDDNGPTFLLDDNPYNCDCQLYKFLDMYKSHKNISKMKLNKSFCNKPEDLKFKKLIDLEPDDLICPTNCVTNEISEYYTLEENCYCLKRPSKYRIEMTCNKIPKVYPPLPSGIKYIYLKLKLSQEITELPQDVQIIDLSSLNITELSYHISSKEVDLSNNSLSRFPIELLQQNCSLHLRNNNFTCSCETKYDMEILEKYKNKTLDYEMIVCSNNVSLSSINIAELCGAQRAVAVGAALALLALAAGVAAAAVHKYRRYLRILLRKCGILTAKASNNYEYDAFISFAHQDEDYVIRNLIPNLENGLNPLKLCVHYRDWIVGDWIPDQIARSVERSHKTIIVLSENFLQSTWSKMEFRQAVLRDTLIILMYEDINDRKTLEPNLRAYISLNTFIKASDPLVYDRLKDAVLKNRKHKEEALDVIYNA